MLSTELCVKGVSVGRQRVSIYFFVKTLRAVTTCRYLPFKWTKVGKEDIRGVKPEDGQDAGNQKA